MNSFSENGATSSHRARPWDIPKDTGMTLLIFIAPGLSSLSSGARIMPLSICTALTLTPLSRANFLLEFSPSWTRQSSVYVITHRSLIFTSTSIFVEELLNERSSHLKRSIEWGRFLQYFPLPVLALDGGPCRHPVLAFGIFDLAVALHREVASYFHHLTSRHVCCQAYISSCHTIPWSRRVGVQK